MNPTVPTRRGTGLRLEDFGPDALADIAYAGSAVIAVVEDGRERTYPERLYRLICRQIDEACERVELVNLAGGMECPPEVARFVEQLQRQASELPAAPRTTVQAHDELFRLSCVLLGRPEGDLDFDREADQEAER